jgi:hypothetical protein
MMNACFATTFGRASSLTGARAQERASSLAQVSESDLEKLRRTERTAVAAVRGALHERGRSFRSSSRRPAA